MALHVDDAAVFSNSRELYDDVFKGMLRIFKIRDDPLEHFLGVVVSRAPDGAFLLSQKPYIEELLVRLGLEDSPTALSPSRGKDWQIDQGDVPSKSGGAKHDDVHPVCPASKGDVSTNCARCG